MTEPSAVLATILDEKEADLARTAQRCLMAALDHSRAARIVLNGSDATGASNPPAIELPPKALRLIADLLGQMARRQPVALFPQELELTTQDAAQILNVSRPFVVKEMEAGRLPHRKVGRHRRIRLEDVMTYQQATRRTSEQALQALADQAQALDLGY